METGQPPEGHSALQAYDFKHMSLDLYIVRTNLNPRTIMRSPGFINSVMVSCHPMFVRAKTIPLAIC